MSPRVLQFGGAVVVFLVIGIALLTFAEKTGVRAIGVGLIGIGLVVATVWAFLEVGLSEDRDRAEGGEPGPPRS